MKFRKRPVEVEAIRFDQTLLSAQEAIASWCHGKLRGYMLEAEDRVIQIETLDGEMTASFGDWIIKGVNEEFYPCKPDIFIKTYEAVA